MCPIEDAMKGIDKSLQELVGLLRNYPEIQVAVAARMQEEYQDARAQGKRSSDIWEIAPPSQR